MEFRVHVQGDRACFKRIEFAEDLVSYDVITPLAARGLLETIYNPPGIRWRIDEIRVLKPIRSTWMSLAETDAGADGATPLDRIFGGKRDRRMASVLTDVGYVLTAHFEILDGAKIRGSAVEDEVIFRRLLAAGGFFRQPSLGLSNFFAQVSAIGAGDPLPESSLIDSGTVDLGWMLYDIDCAEGEGVRLFRPNMVDGVIDLRRREALILAR